jgi:hypothetical protein
VLRKEAIGGGGGRPRGEEGADQWRRRHTRLPTTPKGRRRGRAPSLSLAPRGEGERGGGAGAAEEERRWHSRRAATPWWTPSARPGTHRKRETKRMGRAAAPKPACRASTTGVTHESRPTRWCDKAGPTTRHASFGQTRVPPCCPQSCQRMRRDKVV